MNPVFEIEDKSKRIIYLTEERWSHIKTDHPEMSTNLEEIKMLLVNPEFVRKSEYDENVRFYYRYYKNIESEAKYLLIAVKYLNGQGFVITAFYTNKVKGGL